MVPCTSQRRTSPVRSYTFVDSATRRFSKLSIEGMETTVAQAENIPLHNTAVAIVPIISSFKNGRTRRRIERAIIYNGTDKKVRRNDCSCENDRCGVCGYCSQCFREGGSHTHDGAVRTASIAHARIGFGIPYPPSDHSSGNVKKGIPVPDVDSSPSRWISPPAFSARSESFLYFPRHPSSSNVFMHFRTDTVVILAITRICIPFPLPLAGVLRKTLTSILTNYSRLSTFERAK